MTDEDYIVADDWIPVMLEFVNDGKLFKLSPKGISMYPIIVGKRDFAKLKKIEFPLKRGDICLYRRDNGKYVLHRIYKVDYDKREYYMMGDYQRIIEGPLREEQMLAVADSIVRKGKEISCSDRRYRFWTSLWMILRPVRPYILKIYDMLKRIFWKGYRDENK